MVVAGRRISKMLTFCTLIYYVYLDRIQQDFRKMLGKKS
jgi:hypothetical protein